MVTGVVVLGVLFLLGIFLLDAVSAPPPSELVPVVVRKTKVTNKKRRARKTAK